LAADIAAACGGVVLSGDPNTVFDGITTDSRDVRPNDLFAPLAGDKFDGHDFILPALEAGARGSLLRRDVDRSIFQQPSKHVLIQVQDTLRALSDLASAHRRYRTHPLIAVTGSSGKTTVKEMIAAVLGRSRRPLVSHGNLNNLVGLPMTVLNLGPSHDCAVVEAGINKNGEMAQLAKAAAPNVAVITTVGPVHLEGLGSIENVAKEKFELVRRLPRDGAAIIPAGDPYLDPLVKQAGVRTVYFGPDQGDFRAKDIRFGEFTQFELIAPSGRQAARLRTPGRHNVANALAAAAACMSIGVGLKDVVDGLAEFTAPSMRMELLPLPGQRLLLRDCYNSNPQSASAALTVLAERGQGRRTLAALADMLELGENSPALHAEVGKTAGRLGIDRVIFTGAFGPPFREGFVSAGGSPDAVTCAPDRDSAWEIIQREWRDYYAVLVKGSRSMKMETIADRLTREE
jgi:UDP-N-acetylmuramoyl-tripeptide--D-alanyl-D-alanine ligase